MTSNEKYTKAMFILFPALAMLLGWGLRGHIGGGPFGAMIPGALVVLSICILLQIPVKTSAILVAFGVVGIGLGGEMTYGQTLGFLRETNTVWWGTIGTTLKGSIWGLLGGIIIALGFLFKNLKQKTILISLVLLLTGMYAGFKLINQPMLIYFSDPSNPRSESWAALLFGALAMLIYLRFVLDKNEFKLLANFAILGLIGGGLGFGLGGFWMVLGNQLPSDIIFKSWWKMMEFTFGFLLGAFLGYAAWRNRKEIKKHTNISEEKLVQHKSNVALELLFVFTLGLFIHFIIPYTLEPFAFSDNSNSGILILFLRDISGLIVNYAFYGLIMIYAALRFPKFAWQIGITLTFCHSIIDINRDHLTEILQVAPTLISIIVILISTGIVAVLTHYFSKKENAKRSLFLLLIWSTVLVSTIKIGFYSEKINLAGKTFCEIICRLYIVDIIFLLAAIMLTIISLKKFKQIL